MRFTGDEHGETECKRGGRSAAGTRCMFLSDVFGKERKKKKSRQRRKPVATRSGDWRQVTCLWLGQELRNRPRPSQLQSLLLLYTITSTSPPRPRYWEANRAKKQYLATTAFPPNENVIPWLTEFPLMLAISFNFLNTPPAVRLAGWNIMRWLLRELSATRPRSPFSCASALILSNCRPGNKSETVNSSRQTADERGAGRHPQLGWECTSKCLGEC